MEELTVTQDNLPSALPELSKFALIGREKLAAVRAEIRAIEKVGLAKEVLEQKRAEAQEIAELVTLSEMRIGAMLKEIPKATSGNNPSGVKKDETQNNPGLNLGKTKSDTIVDLGFTPNQVSQFQRMADNEETVMTAIAEAREDGDIVSRSKVMQKIKEKEESVRKTKRKINRGNPASLVPGGFTKEQLAEREKITAIVTRMYGEGTVEYSAEHLIEEITVNGNEYVSLLGNELKDHAELLEGNRGIIAEAIDKIITQIERIKEEQL